MGGVIKNRESRESRDAMKNGEHVRDLDHDPGKRWWHVFSHSTKPTAAEPMKSDPAPLKNLPQCFYRSKATQLAKLFLF